MSQRQHELSGPQCEWQDCAKRAQCGVNAQWTLVDFVEYFACEDHAYDMLDVLRRRRVDGELPVDFWVSTWWPGSS